MTNLAEIPTSDRNVDIRAAIGEQRLNIAGGQMANVLRTALPTYDERKAAGRALRDKVKRGDLGRWRPKEDRPNPVDLIEEAHAGRLERLIPVRVGRMVASPYAFLRGAASLMAEDFARMARTGIEPVICGDAHLGNFGFYASPERNLVFDLNDFDEWHTQAHGNGTCGGWLRAFGWSAGRTAWLMGPAKTPRCGARRRTAGKLP